MNYVTDTHPLIWALFAQRRLSQHVREIFQGAATGEHTIYIPALVVAEMIMVVEKGRVTATISEVLAALQLMQASSSYQFLPLLPDTVVGSHTLTPIPDIFDRLIVAEAIHLQLPLITVDSVIRDSGLVTVVWN